MISELMGSGQAGGFALTALVSGFTLLGTWVPFQRGLRIFLRALAATRAVETAEVRRGAVLEGGRGVEPLALLLVKVIRKSLREGGADSYPSDFVVDASRQYVMNEYDAHYARRISMYSNILPPIGFIGTTTGLFVLFLSMRVGSDSLELGALALALTSSIFALIGFAVLEGLKIFLYGRLLSALAHVLALQRSPAAQPSRKSASTGTPAHSAG